MKVKLTFIGDLMCQLQQISAVRKAGCGYDVVFDGVRDLWADSDYVIANLETPVDSQSRLAYEEVRFNAPTEFLDAIANAHIDCLTCANNHILDRGKRGIDSTLDEISHRGIVALGAYKTEEESEGVFSKVIGGIRFAFVACTYDMNPGRRTNMLKDHELWKVDLLQHPAPWPGSWRYAIRRTLIGLVPYKVKQWLKQKRYGRNYVNANPQPDCAAAETFLFPEHKPFLERVIEKIKSAKQIADVVVVLPHIGGQYNSEPGPWQLLATDAFIEAGADLVIANHAHTPLKVERRNGTLVAHALGNFCFTPGVGFYNDSCQADYSIALSCVFDVKSKKMVRESFVVLKTMTRKDGVSVVVLPEAKDTNDVETVIRRVCGHKKVFVSGQEIEL